MRAQEFPPDQNAGPTILGLVWSSTGLAAIFVTLRFYDRIFLHSGLGWDDWTILCAIIIALFGATCNTIMVENNWGRHIEYLSEENVSKSLQWVTYAVIQSYIAIYLVKMSVCFFVLRIMSNTNDRIRWAVYAIMGILTVATIVGVTMTATSCIPMEGIWNLDPHFPKKCLPAHVQVSVARAFAVITIVTDLACVFMPAWVVRTLHMNNRQKATVIGIMSLGLITTACAVVKAVTTTFGSRDASWEDTVPLIFSALEESLGTIAASMPALRHTFRRFLHSPSSLKGTQRTPGIGSYSYPIYGHDQSTFKSKISGGHSGFSKMGTAEDILLEAPAEHRSVLQTVSFEVQTQRASEISDTQGLRANRGHL